MDYKTGKTIEDIMYQIEKALGFFSDKKLTEDPNVLTFLRQILQTLVEITSTHND
jgi:hypothetical protein